MIFALNSRALPARRRVFLAALASAGAFTLFPAIANALLVINQPWLLPAGRAGTTSAFMNLTSTDGATLMGADSEDARRVTIRSKLPRPSTPLPLPAAREVRLAPGGDHLTLTGLARPLRLGDRVVIKLTLRDSDGAMREIPVNAEVRLRSPIEDERREHHHH